MMDALQVRGGVHSNDAVGVERLATVWRRPAVKQSSHCQQLPASPLIWRLFLLVSGEQRSFGESINTADAQ